MWPGTEPLNMYPESQLSPGSLLQWAESGQTAWPTSTPVQEAAETADSQPAESVTRQPAWQAAGTATAPADTEQPDTMPSQAQPGSEQALLAKKEDARRRNRSKYSLLALLPQPSSDTSSAKSQ